MATRVEDRFRRFLLLLAACMCVGTIVELVLEEHYEEPTQLIPFVLCTLGLAAIIAVIFRPQRLTIWLLRVVMAVTIAGSLFGVWEHLEGNLGFARDIQPNAAESTVLLDALRGANPLLAPGILALGGILAIAGTYAHPALQRRPADIVAPSAQP